MPDTRRPARIAIIHYSATGNVYRLAEAIAEGARSAGAETRVRRVAELAPVDAISSNERWQAHSEFAEREIALAELDDLAWADGIALGSPTRFGLPTAQLKQFLDQTGGLWATKTFINKVVTGFTSVSTNHGGAESTILATLNVAYHWGAVILPTGYATNEISALGNPYGTGYVSRQGAGPGEVEIAAAASQGRRLAEVAARFID